MVAGPAAGTILVGLGSAPAALRVNGLSFLLAAAATVPLPAHPPAGGGEQGLARMVDGFRAARRVGWVGGTIPLISITNLGIIGAQRLTLPAAAADRYGQLGGYGTIVVAIAAGGVLAAWVTGRSPWPRQPGVATYQAEVLLGAATLSFGRARGIVAAALLGLAFGAGQQRVWVTSLQRNVPDRLRGRVTAVAEFGSLVCLPVSFAVGGLVVERRLLTLLSNRQPPLQLVRTRHHAVHTARLLHSRAYGCVATCVSRPRPPCQLSLGRR